MQETIDNNTGNVAEANPKGEIAKTSDAAASPSERQSDIWSNLLRLLSPIPFLLLLVTAYSVFAESVDDPFITFRYALNLLHGYGPVFNPGERVEGFTSALHLLLCALLIKIAPSVPLLFKAKLASLAFGFVFLAQVRSLARTFGLAEWQGVLAQALIALNLNFVVPMVNGLETTLYAVLLTASIQWFAEETQGKRTGILSAAWLFAAFLTRPDALLSFAAFGCVQLWRIHRRDVTWMTVIRWGAIFLLPLLLLTVARLSYFGSPLPNTFYAKHVTPAVGLRFGISYLLRPMMPDAVKLQFPPPQHGPLQFRLLLPELLWYWGLFALGLGRLRAVKASPVLIAELIALFVLILGTGGDWMLGWRFVLPFAACVTLVQCLGVVSAGQFLAKAVRLESVQTSLAATAAASLALWTMAAWFNPHYTWASVGYSMRDEALLHSAMYGEVWVAGADYIHDQLPPGATVAGSEMGYAPYVNMDKYFFDIRGLTDSKVAHLTGVPRSMTGVLDDHWFEPDSPIGCRILQCKPALIYVIGRKVRVPLILNGQYSLTPLSDDMQTRAKRKHVSVTFYLPVRPSQASPPSLSR